MRVALVHDWLTGMRGGEKVLLSLLRLFPDAVIYTLLHVKGSVAPEIEARPIRTSFVQRLPGVARHYRRYLPLFPAAIGSLDLDDATWRARPAPAEWAPIEIICHLRDEEAEDFGARVGVVLDGGTAFAPIDPTGWVEARRYRAADPAAALATLRAARARHLERHWPEAVAEVGPQRARVWRLYMAACRLGFERNVVQLHQVLGVRLDGTASGMALRPDW